MTKNDSNELLDVLSILSLEMAKYNLRNNLEALKNDIENYNKKKLGEMEELLVNKQFLSVLHSKNKDNNYQSKIIKSYKRYNSSKLMKNYENNNKDNFSPKKSVDMAKDKYQIKSMLVESKEKNDEKPLSSIKRSKRYDSRKSAIVIPILSENEQANKNINKDIENSKSNYSNSKINNEKKDDSNTFTISESDSDSDNSNDKKSKNRSEKINKNKNLENRDIENSQKVLKTYIKKLSSKFEDKKVSFHVEEHIFNKSHRSNSRKNSILSEDVLKKNSSIMKNNQKINNNINSNKNKNRISNLKNYKPNYQNKQNNQNNINNPIKNNNSDNNNNTQKKQKNSIESVKEKISIIAEESLNTERSPKVEEKVKFKRGCKKHRTLYSTLTSPLELTNVIKDENFMDIINDDFSLSVQGASFTKEDLEVDLLNQQKQSYNNSELTNSYNNYYSSKSLEMLMQSSSSKTSKKKKKEKIIEERPFMKKYQISSSFAERQMKIMQIKNNNINKLKIKLEKKNNFEHSPKINSNSQKLIKQKGIYIPIYKRSVKIQYDKNLKFNLFSKMRKDSKIKNEKNKGHLSYRGQGKNSNNNKIVKFFESQINWKEKVNSKTKKLKNSLEKEKENSLNEELLFKPIIFNNSEYKIKNKSKSIFMKLYNDQNIKEKNLEKLKKKLTPSFIPNINDEKRLHYYNKKNSNILNNYSKFNMNSNNTSRLRNNISSNFNKLSKILYYEEEDSSAALTNRLKGYENLEISKIKKDSIKKIEKDDTLASLTGLESDLNNNKFPNINESNSICLGHGFIYPDSDRNIIYNQYNNINNNYINYSNKSEILKNKIMHEKENRFNQKIDDIDEISKKSLLSYFKGDDIVNPNKSMEIISGNVKNYVNSYYENLNFEKIRDNYNCKIEDESKSEILKKNKINNISEEKDEQSIYFDLWNFNNKQNEIVDERKEKDKKKKCNEYSYIMKEKKEKIKQLKYIK